MSDTKWLAYQNSLRVLDTIMATTSCVRHEAERGEPCFLFESSRRPSTPLAVCGNRFRDWSRGHDSTGSPTG